MDPLPMLCLALALPAPAGDADTDPALAPALGVEATTTSQRLWSWNAGTSGTGLALAERGTQAFVYGGGIELLSTFDPQPPLPVWESTQYGWSVVRGADATDTVIGSTIEIVGVVDAEAFLTRHRSGSPDPVWSWSYGVHPFPVPYYDVSRDGQTIVSIFETGIPGDHVLRVHDLDTGLPTTTWNLPIITWTQRLDLSPDGSVVAFSDDDGTGVTRVVDLATGNVVLTTPGSIPADQAISDGGQVLVVRIKVEDVGWIFRVLSRAGGAWQPVVEVSTDLTEYPQELAVSDDGSLAVATWRDDDAPWEVVLRAYDAATGALLLERTPGDPGGEYEHNYATDVSVSADGTRFAMSTWGTGVSGPSELVVYDPWADSNVASFPQGGSAMEAILSADGRFLLVDRIPTHANQGHTQRFAEMYEIGGSDLAASGVPSLGGSVRVDVYGEPGSPALLLASAGLAAAPLPVGAGGELVLDPDTLLILGLGAIGPGGTASLEFDVPVLGSLVGLSLFTQGATTGPKTLGDTWLKLTVLP